MNVSGEGVKAETGRYAQNLALGERERGDWVWQKRDKRGKRGDDGVEFVRRKGRL